MTIDYDFQNNIITYKCNLCGYVYSIDKNDDYHDKVVKGEEPFIELESLKKLTDYDSYGNLAYVSIYACPKCGCLQTDI